MGELPAYFSALHFAGWRIRSQSLRSRQRQDMASSYPMLNELLGRPLDRWVTSPRQTAYRARIDLNVRGGKPGVMKRGSNSFQPIDREPLAREEVDEALHALAARDLGALTRVEIRSDGRKVVLNGTGPSEHLRDLGFPAARDGKAVAGDPQLWLENRGLRMRVSAGSFYQVNLEVNTLLVEEVHDAVMSLEPTCVLDLYAGIGNLSLPFADRVPVTLVESAGSAMRDARDTARRHGLRVDARTGDAARFRAGDAAFDVALLDPPRAGAHRVLDQLLVTRPKGIVYVSCNPATLARDTRSAADAGYRVTRAVGFDMFPGTGHVEAMVVLSR